MRWPSGCRQAPAGGHGHDRLGRVAHPGGDQQLLLRGHRRGIACKERMSVRRGAFVVGVAVQDRLEVASAVVMRRSIEMVVSQVQSHSHSERDRRSNGEQGGRRPGTLEGTPHGVSIFDGSQAVKAVTRWRPLRNVLVVRPSAQRVP